MVMAIWKTSHSGTAQMCYGLEVAETEEVLRAARFNKILVHSNNMFKTHPLPMFLYISLSWYHFHPKLNSLGKPVTVWCGDLFEVGGIHSIILIE